jgi:acyl dehydratase
MTMTITANGIAEIKALAGSDLQATDWMEITQERVNAFADATGDQQWIHVDPEKAAGGPFGTTIAHGYLTLSLIIPLFNDLLKIEGVSMGVNYGLDKVRFPAPVPVGSKIRLTGKVGDVDDVPGGVQMKMVFTVEIEGNAKPACVAEAIYRQYS